MLMPPPNLSRPPRLGSAGRRAPLCKYSAPEGSDRTRRPSRRDEAPLAPLGASRCSGGLLLSSLCVLARDSAHCRPLSAAPSGSRPVEFQPSDGCRYGQSPCVKCSALHPPRVSANRYPGSWGICAFAIAYRISWHLETSCIPSIRRYFAGRRVIGAVRSRSRRTL